MNNYRESLLYKSLIEKNNNNCQIISNLDSCIEQSIQLSKTIISSMPKYTLHDVNHQLKVLQIMDIILGKENIKILSVTEKYILIILAFTHDVGMALDNETIEKLKKSFEYNSTDDSNNDFSDFKNEHLSKIEEYKIALKKGYNNDAENIRDFIISDYIRKSHAELSVKFIRTKLKDKLIIANNNLTEIICKLCLNHVKDGQVLLDFENFKPDYPINNNDEVCLPLLGMIFRLADILDFDSERTPDILFKHIFSNNDINLHQNSIEEWNKHRAIENLIFNNGQINIKAKCSHPSIQKTIYDFCNKIDIELKNAHDILSRLKDIIKFTNRKIKINLPYKINREYFEPETDNNGHEKYEYIDLFFKLSKDKIMSYLLGSKLYNDPTACLRELVQNSRDACLCRKALLERDGNTTYKPLIEIKYYKENNETYLEVNDNGIGMDKEIIKKYYSNVGESYYKSVDFNCFKNKTNANFNPTSRFGIGILSIFMISDYITVQTKRQLGIRQESEPINIEIEGINNIFVIKKGLDNDIGTKTKLKLKEDPWKNNFLFPDKFKKDINNLFPNLGMELSIVTSEFIDKNFESINFKNLNSRFNDFKNSLDNWSDIENIEIVEIVLENKYYNGMALLAFIFNKELPVENVIEREKEITIYEKEYNLSTKLSYDFNKIKQNYNTLSISINEEVEVTSADKNIFISNSILSLHGIKIDNKLFERNDWDIRDKKRQNKVSLNWYFPTAILLDITEDLDINAARTEFEYNDKWIKFETELIQDIYSKIKEIKGEEYFDKLIKIGYENSKDEIYKKALKKFVKNNEKNDEISNFTKNLDIDNLPF
ncbi:MAG: ATP-binding protein [Alphaproteobacteria bacterium]|nr:ATP-binding protein [Alphaproteobacteria bacterium]